MNCQICKNPLTSHDLYDISICLTRLMAKADQLRYEIKYVTGSKLESIQDEANETLASNEVKE